jgi:hypothetical protein
MTILRPKKAAFSVPASIILRSVYRLTPVVSSTSSMLSARLVRGATFLRFSLALIVFFICTFLSLRRFTSEQELASHGQTPIFPLARRVRQNNWRPPNLRTSRHKDTVLTCGLSRPILLFSFIGSFFARENDAR